MNNKQKNVLVGIAILAVTLLIVFNTSEKNPQLKISNTKMLTPFFPTQKERQAVAMQALITGELKLEGKCLKVDDNLIVWPYGYSLKIQDDTIKILNEKGKLMAIVGEIVKLGGGQVGTNESALEELSEYQNKDCKGPLWIVGKVMPTMK